jgi:RNA polymerase sigma factor (sigma-70 family)
LLKQTEDINLWDAFLKSDRNALGMLFSRHYPMLFQYGCKISQDTATIEDCIQELFSDLWRNRPQTPSVSIKAYLLKALKYKILRQLGKNQKVSLENDPDVGLFEISHEAFLIETYENKRKALQVAAALNQLSPRQKEVVYLKFYQNLKYEELSLVMNINYQVARNLLYQAMRSMKKLMENSFLFFL